MTSALRKAILAALAVGPLCLLLYTLLSVRVWQFGPSLMLYVMFGMVTALCFWLFFLLFFWNTRIKTIAVATLLATAALLTTVELYASRQERQVKARCAADCGSGITEARWSPFESSVLGCTPSGLCWGND